jgi:hypothetical protein
VVAVQGDPSVEGGDSMFIVPAPTLPPVLEAPYKLPPSGVTAVGLGTRVSKTFSAHGSPDPAGGINLNIEPIPGDSPPWVVPNRDPDGPNVRRASGRPPLTDPPGKLYIVFRLGLCARPISAQSDAVSARSVAPRRPPQLEELTCVRMKSTVSLRERKVKLTLVPVFGRCLSREGVLATCRRGGDCPFRCAPSADDGRLTWLRSSGKEALCPESGGRARRTLWVPRRTPP